LVHSAVKARHYKVEAIPQERDSKNWDIQVYLHNLWLEKMTTSSLYDDATILHGFRCRCCSRTLFLMEERRK
jgi:hypothetical protein